MTMGGTDARVDIDAGFRQIVDALPELIWTVDADGSSDFVNHRWCEYTGQGFGQAVGSGWHAAIHPDHLTEFLASCAGIARTGLPGEIAARLRRFDGEYRWFALRFAPLPSAQQDQNQTREQGGRGCRWCVSANHSEVLAHLSEGQRLSKTATFTSDIQFDQNSWSDELFRIFEVDPRDQPSIQLIRSRVHPEDLALFDRSMRPGAGAQEAEFSFRIVAPRGGLKYLRAVSRVIEHVDGRPIYMGTVQDVTEARRAEESLRASERALRGVIDTIPCLAWSARADGWTDFLNQRWLDYTGLSAEQAMGHGWIVAVHPDDTPGLWEAWKEALEQGVGRDVSARLRRFDGVYRWFLFRSNSQRDETGKVVKWYGTPIDIDDLKHAEALLAGEVRVLEMIARGKPLLDVLDALCRLIEALVPDCVCSILSVGPDRKHFGSAVGPSLPDAFNRMFDGKAIDGDDGPCSLAVLEKTQIVTSDLAGDSRWSGSPWPERMRGHGYVSCCSTPTMSVSGEVSGIFAMYRRDAVSPTPEELKLVARLAHLASIALDRAQADEALRRSEEELRRTLAQLSEGQRLSKTGSFTWDVLAERHIWSREMHRIMGHDPDAGVAISTPMLVRAVHPDDRPEVERLIAGASEVHDFDLFFRIVTPAGEIRHTHVVAHRLAHVAERPVFLGALQDVTDARIAEEALTQARAELAHVARITALSALTASIAHEVSQPLAGILINANTCLRMLAADPPDLDGAAATARRTIRDTDRATEVIKRLRALFARKPPSVEPVDLNEVAREVIMLSSNELRRARVLVQTDLGANLPRVDGDRVQLQQVVVNLLLNAADAMADVDDRPRTLLLQTRPDDAGCVTLAVRDSGVGVDAESVDKLFSAFFSTKPNGMGVGLSISRSIIEGHEGRLWASANNDGPGATFCFRIPCAPRRVAANRQDGGAGLAAR